MPDLPRAWVEINPKAISHNLSEVKIRTPQAKVMAVIKGNAYGHGVELAFKALQGADEFAVTDMSELHALGSFKESASFTVLSHAPNVQDFQRMARNGVNPTIYSFAQLDTLRKCRFDCPLDIWLKVDTGMGRLGFTTDQAREILPTLKSLINGGQVRLMTHLAEADDDQSSATVNQIRAIESFANSQQLRVLSVLNSAGVCAHSQAAHQVVRPGVMLYGISPMLDKVGCELNLQAAMTFKSQVITVKEMQAGARIGYGGTYILPRRSRIAVVSVGYADGYPRHAKTGTPVLIAGNSYPLVGRVSMDLITIDVAQSEVQVADEVILWGPDNPVENIAKHADTIAYELLCGITARVERRTVSTIDTKQ